MRLFELGEERGFRVAASGCNAHDPEWLYDMVWLRLTNDNKLLTQQAMVLESEWNYGKFYEAAEVNIDFQKLVQARADARVWLFAVPNAGILSEHIANCRKQVETFSGTVPGDCYLFFGLAWEDNSFKHEVYTA
jgi:hypothetical protein